MKYIKGFDTIRALAILIVIVGHWGLPFVHNAVLGNQIDLLIRGGVLGVIIFFVLSGFLITSILLNERDRNTDGNRIIIIKNFFARRALRIFPIYYLVVFIFIFSADPFVREHILYFLTYTTNLLPYWTDQANILSHTWSLSVEEQFYLIWPWLIVFTNKKYTKYIFYVSIIIGVVSKYYVLFVLHHHYPVLVFNCLDSFGVGGLYAWIRLDKENCRKFERSFVVVFPLMLFVSLQIAHVSGLPVLIMYDRFLESVIGLAMIIYVYKNRSEWVRKYILENRLLNFIGKISYGIYLYHFTYYASFNNLLNKFVSFVPSCSFLTNQDITYILRISSLIFICWLSFRFIEQPIMRLKRKFEYSGK